MTQYPTIENHVDNFIDFGAKAIGAKKSEHDDYARFVLDYFRKSAILKNTFKPFMQQYLLFCVFEKKPYRVIGASRLGDIWLTSNLQKETGYDKRVFVKECSRWNPSIVELKRNEI